MSIQRCSACDTARAMLRGYTGTGRTSFPTRQSAARRAESCRVHGEVNLDCAEGPARFRDKRAQDRRGLGILQHVQDCVVAGCRADETALVRFPEIGHEPTRGKRRVDFKGRTEYS